jgi:hypothetical protein
MNHALYEQRNSYKGSPPRAWARIRLVVPDGATHERELLVDTGSPFALILGQADMAALQFSLGMSRMTNFGNLQGGWLRLAMPEFGLSQDVEGFASDVILATAKNNSPDFEGLLGLPLLRLLEYGGDADWFWLRQVSPP